MTLPKIIEQQLIRRVARVAELEEIVSRNPLFDILGLHDSLPKRILHLSTIPLIILCLSAITKSLTGPFVGNKLRREVATL